MWLTNAISIAAYHDLGENKKLKIQKQFKKEIS